jgi:hypothetical protein
VIWLWMPGVPPAVVGGVRLAGIKGLRGSPLISAFVISGDPLSARTLSARYAPESELAYGNS